MGHKSENSLIKYGVPQGSILGQLLVIIYMNDLMENVVDSNVKLYADDTAIYSSANSHIELILNMRLELDVVTEWLKANKLTLNTQKTKYVIFGSKTRTATCSALNLKINGSTLEQVPIMKYLDMMLNQHVTFGDHVVYLHGKWFKSLAYSEDLIISWIKVHLFYCTRVWSCHTLTTAKLSTAVPAKAIFRSFRNDKTPRAGPCFW